MFTGLAQLVEHWSPKPGVGSSSLSTRANSEKTMKKILADIKESYNELVYRSNLMQKSRIPTLAILCIRY